MTAPVAPTRITTVLFDLGGVVVDWDPARLYRKIFAGDEAKVRWFLETICTDPWNTAQDAGRPLAHGTDLLVAQHPDWEPEIRAFYDRWIEMIAGPVPGTATLIRDLRDAGTRLFALSNWSAETFPRVQDDFPELALFERVFLSGNLGVAKPDARFYRAVLAELTAPPAEMVFLDDDPANVAGAEAVGVRAIRFTSADQARGALRALGLKC